MRKAQLTAKQSGFTLIELVIVIVILGILAAVALPNFQDVTGDAANAKAKYSNGVTNTQQQFNGAYGTLQNNRP